MNHSDIRPVVVCGIGTRIYLVLRHEVQIIRIFVNLQNRLGLWDRRINVGLGKISIFGDLVERQRGVMEGQIEAEDVATVVKLGGLVEASCILGLENADQFELVEVEYAGS